MKSNSLKDFLAQEGNETATPGTGLSTKPRDTYPAKPRSKPNSRGKSNKPSAFVNRILNVPPPHPMR